MVVWPHTLVPLNPPKAKVSHALVAWEWVGTFQACFGATEVATFNALQKPPSPLHHPTPSWVRASARMPHICGPHSQLPHCRYNQEQRRREQQGNANTTWVPIPIHKVQEVTESEVRKVDNNYNRNANYHVQQPQQRSTPGQSRSVPIQLASPNLIIKAGKQKDLPAKDELFPRKKKSEFTIWTFWGDVVFDDLATINKLLLLIWSKYYQTRLCIYTFLNWLRVFLWCILPLMCDLPSLGRCAKNQNGNLRWHLPLGVRSPPPLMPQISRHFFTPLFRCASISWIHVGVSVSESVGNVF